MNDTDNMSLYQSFIRLKGCARWIDSLGRREQWDETVSRYMDFMREHLAENQSYAMPDELYSTVYDAIFNLHVVPSMRALATAGEALKRENMSGYNCAATAIDRLRAFDEALYILLCGTGLGFSVERQYISKLPDISSDFHTTDTTIVVGDSKLGWAKAFKELLSLLVVGEIPKWDMSKVRPKGARLKVFGGRASGPEPLNQLFKHTVNVFSNAKGRKLTSLEAHSLMCKIADIVVVGGVRRAALISLSNLSDNRMRHAKSGDWRIANPEYARANNSVCYTDKPDTDIYISEFLALIESKSGERGIFNRQAVKKSIEAINKRAGFERRDPNVEYLTNPCLTGDTMVAVANGRDNVSIKELADIGADVPVYCLDENNKIAIRTMRHPRITGCNTPVFRLTLDDGSHVDCTKNHKFLVRDKGYVELKDLNKGDSLRLMSKYQEKLKKVVYNDDGVSQDYWWINNNEKDVAEHKMIAEFHRGAETGYGNVVHHKDFNALNNHPDNLDVMSRGDHCKLHGKDMLGDKNPMRRAKHEWNKERWARYSSNMSDAVSGEKNGRYSGIANEVIRKHIVELTRSVGCRVSRRCWVKYAQANGLPQHFSDYRVKNLGTLTALSKWAAKECGFNSTCDPRVYKTYTSLLDQGYDCDIVDDQVLITKQCEECSKDFTVPSERREVCFCSRECHGKYNFRVNREIITAGMIEYHNERKDILRIDQIKVYKNIQSDLGRQPCKKEWIDQCKEDGVSFEISRVSSPFRYWKDLKESADNYNHRVVSVEYLNHQDVYNGTVDDYHNFFVGGFETNTENGKRKYCYINNLQCGEIFLQNRATCNLSEAIIRASDSVTDIEEKLEIATILGTWQASLTNFKYISSAWKRNCEDEALLGVSMTGIMDNEITNGGHGVNMLRDSLNQWRGQVTLANEVHAKFIGINPAKAITCVKPSGNTSQLADCSSGIHARHSEYYTRLATLNRSDSLAKYMVDNGFPHEDSVYSEADVLFKFPVKSPAGCVTRHDRTALEQLAFWLVYKLEWCDHNPSTTIFVKQDEWCDVLAWTYNNFDNVCGVTFFSDHEYQQAPYQECDKAAYEKLKAEMPKFFDQEAFNKFETEDNTEVSQTLACSSGGCEI